MKLFSEAYSGKKPEGAKKVTTYTFAPKGPVIKDSIGELPLHRGIYLGFKFNKDKVKNGVISFTEFVYVGRAIKDNTLRKRVGEHYSQKDLKYRESGKTVDMSNVAFLYLDLDNLADDQISDIEYAFISEYQPSANSDGIGHYAGKEAPLCISVISFPGADDLNLSRSFLISEKDKEVDNEK